MKVVTMVSGSVGALSSWWAPAAKGQADCRDDPLYTL